MKTESTTQLTLAGIHFYAGILAAFALVVHGLAVRYHILRWRDLP